VVVAYDCQANLLQMLLFVVRSGYFGLKWFGNRRTEMKSASKANKKKKNRNPNQNCWSWPKMSEDYDDFLRERMGWK